MFLVGAMPVVEEVSAHLGPAIVLARLLFVGEEEKEEKEEVEEVVVVVETEEGKG